MRGSLHGGAAARAYTGTDGCTLTATREAADECTENRATTDDCGEAFAARGALLLNITGLQRIGSALIRDAIERDGEFAAPFEFPGGIGADELEANVKTFGKNDAVVHNDGSVKGVGGEAGRFLAGDLGGKWRTGAGSGAGGETGSVAAIGGAGGAMVVESITCFTPSIWEAMVLAARRAASSGTTPERVTMPSLLATPTEADLRRGSENILALI